LPPTPRRRCGRRLRVAGSRIKPPTEGEGAEYVLVGAHVRASAACSAGRPVRAAIASAIATSALVGFTRTSAILSKPFADTCRSKSLLKCGSTQSSCERLPYRYRVTGPRPVKIVRSNPNSRPGRSGGLRDGLCSSALMQTTGHAPSRDRRASVRHNEGADGAHISSP
jgi:hypothetical protein